jgi:hypothetical protein
LRHRRETSTYTLWKEEEAAAEEAAEEESRGGGEEEMKRRGEWRRRGWRRRKEGTELWGRNGIFSIATSLSLKSLYSVVNKLRLHILFFLLHGSPA